jgi:hypothetical protein
MNFFVCFSPQLAKLVSHDVNPRESWAAFLTSVCHEVPSDKFREFQMATFNICMRYVTERPLVDPTPVPPPRAVTQRPPAQLAPLVPGTTAPHAPHVPHVPQQQQQQAECSQWVQTQPQPLPQQPQQAWPYTVSIALTNSFNLIILLTFKKFTYIIIE